MAHTQYLHNEPLNSLGNCLKAYIYFSAFQHDVNIMNFSIFMQNLPTTFPHSSRASCMSLSSHSCVVAEWTVSFLKISVRIRKCRQPFLAKPFQFVPKSSLLFCLVSFILSFDLCIFCITVTVRIFFHLIFQNAMCIIYHIELYSAMADFTVWIVTYNRASKRLLYDTSTLHAF